MDRQPNRAYLWLPCSKAAKDQKGSGRIATPPAPLALPENRTPTRVWSLLFFGSDQLIPPENLPLIHGDTASLESPLHDYRISRGHLIYRGSFSSGGVWLALEYDS